MGVRVHLIDGTYELFRAHFSKRPPHRSPDGRDLKATVGVASSLLSLLDDPKEAVTHLAVAFDNPIRSFRNELFAGYKTEAGVPAELLAQLDAVEEATRALGVVVWSMKEFEADDALATAAARFEKAKGVDQVRLLTPDKDLAQCLSDTRVVQVDRLREKETDEAAFVKAKGYGPKSVPDFLALVGDTADGIPGLDGFGEKSTAALLSEHPHLEDIPDEIAAWRARPRGAEKLAATLREHRKEALLYRTLATVRRDVPLQEDLAALAFHGVPRALFQSWCTKVGTRSLAARPKRWA